MLRLGSITATVRVDTSGNGSVQQFYVALHSERYKNIGTSTIITRW